MRFSIIRAPFAITLLVFAMTGSSCHKKQVPIAPPAQPEPAPAVETHPEQHPAPPVKAAPPNVTPPIQTTPAKDESKYQQSKPAEQAPPPKRVVTRPASPAPAATPPAPAPTPPAEPPRLGDILTPEQERQYNGAIDQSITHAQASLGSLASRQLTKEQEATVAQVQNFVQQAQETRKTDLAAAKSLAERAEVLAHDLVESLK